MRTYGVSLARATQAFISLNTYSNPVNLSASAR
jgi:hypothetical protein